MQSNPAQSIPPASKIARYYSPSRDASSPLVIIIVIASICICKISPNTSDETSRRQLGNVTHLVSMLDARPLECRISTGKLLLLRLNSKVFWGEWREAD
ncbi:hypothetical protein TWF191_002155 [Orbilia oligospora]|uniref:Uncharacterized protein n=1 Tax=Orbilia oligospora TaxID=2813651 RepID=A0A7C8QBA3_ORBOL|nr:hypothetical protein TWF191_002155 [Orbilia oligospora]